MFNKRTKIKNTSATNMYLFIVIITILLLLLLNVFVPISNRSLPPTVDRDL